MSTCFINPDGSHVRGCDQHSGKHPYDWCKEPVREPMTTERVKELLKRFATRPLDVTSESHINEALDVIEWFVGQVEQKYDLEPIQNLRWQSGLPTSPGYYWFKDEEFSWISETTMFRGKLCKLDDTGCVPLTYLNFIAFAGPIPEPT